MRAAQTDATFHLILCEGSGASRMGVELASDGNIKMLTSTGWTTLQTYSANTWYRFAIDFDDGGANPNRSRVRVDNGSYSAWSLVNTSNYTNISCIQLEHTAAAGKDFFVDYLTDTDFYQTTSVSDTVTSTDALSTLKTDSISVSDTVTTTDSQQSKNGFSNTAKSSTTWTDQDKS